jgi:hypothetical protein
MILERFRWLFGEKRIAGLSVVGRRNCARRSIKPQKEAAPVCCLGRFIPQWRCTSFSKSLKELLFSVSQGPAGFI